MKKPVNTVRRLSVLMGVLALALGGGASSVFADANWPSKPITIVVPFPAGGGTDAFARPLSAHLTKQMGKQIIIDNRGGAGGSIGTEIAAKSPADGYTVLFTLSSHTINPAIYPKLTFDTEKDFLPVSLVASLPQILVANPDFPAKTVKEVIDMAKAKPDSISYASVGNGSPGHLAGAMMAGSAGVGAQTDPARQNVQQKLDLSRAEIDQIASILRREQVTDQELVSRRADLEQLGMKKSPRPVARRRREQGRKQARAHGVEIGRNRILQLPCLVAAAE